MIVTTLGTSSPYPRPHNPCSSFLLDCAGTKLWIDTGAGTLTALLEQSSLEQLDAVWISHTHADHFSDLAVAFYALRFGGIERPPLTVFGPPGWAERLRAFVTHNRRSPLEDVFDIREIVDRDLVVVDNLTLTGIRVRHDAECFGLRVQGEGRVAAYTGDTGLCDGLTALASQAHLLICEAGYGLAESETDEVHLTAGQAGTVAAMGNVDLLLLTHLAKADPQQCVDAAVAAGARSVLAARPGLAVDV